MHAHHEQPPARAGFWAGLTLALLLAGCATGPGRPGTDGAESTPPSGLGQIPDAEPREEAIRQSGGTSKPYTVLGRSYAPITDDRPFRERGLASWYGRKFHGQSTASGEPYDMYAMTAAHKTLPLPSYVRVRNPANGRAVILRVNDRGPFHADRVIDLSYTAALQLDLLRGVAPVEVERITNADIRAGTWRRADDTRLAAAAPGATPARTDAVAATPAGAAPDAGPRRDRVEVPAGWVLPVAAAAPEARDDGHAGARPILLAQAAPPSDAAVPPASVDPMTDAAPPPRFRNMQANELPPLTPPAPSAQPAPAAQPAAPGGAPSAAPTVPADPAAASAASLAAPGGLWVQLGAFREPAGAQDLQARVARSLPSLASRLRVFSESGTHRLQAGPFASREEAQDAGTQLRNGLGLAPIVVERR